MCECKLLFLSNASLNSGDITSIFLLAFLPKYELINDKLDKPLPITTIPKFFFVLMTRYLPSNNI